MDVNKMGVERCIREGPGWLDRLLVCDYFSACLLHKSSRPVRNHFCVECNEGPICSVGLDSHHNGHKTLQIRKASHHDAIKVSDIQRFVDISGIQCYSINADKIVFLLRPKAKLHQGRSKRRCINCKRALNDAGMLMCSIKCKLNAVRESLSRQGGANNNDGFDKSVISLALGEGEGEVGGLVNHIGGINCTSCCDGKKRRIENHVMVQGPENNLSMEEGRSNHNAALFFPVSPDSVLRSDSPDSSYPGCHCGEEKRPQFQISLPPPAMEHGEFTSTSQQQQCREQHHYQHRRKGTPHRAPLF